MGFKREDIRDTSPLSLKKLNDTLRYLWLHSFGNIDFADLSETLKGVINNKVGNTTFTQEIDAVNQALVNKASQSSVDSLGNKVTNAESTITQQAGQIASKVDVAGVKSTIEENPNSVKIGFNGISDKIVMDITGLTIKNGAIGIYNNVNVLVLYLDSNGFISTKKAMGVYATDDNYPTYGSTLYQNYGLYHMVNQSYPNNPCLMLSDSPFAFKTATIGGQANAYVNVECKYLDLSPDSSGWSFIRCAGNSADGVALWNNFTSGYMSLKCQNFNAYGTKNAVVKTADYGYRKISAYETAEYYFGDIGHAKTVNGECIIQLEDIFKQTVNTNIEYEVFISKYGRGDIWVETRTPDYFVVKSDNNIEFSYEIKAKRLNYENTRLEPVAEDNAMDMEVAI